jgi:hypothetical protein
LESDAVHVGEHHAGCRLREDCLTPKPQRGTTGPITVGCDERTPAETDHRSAVTGGRAGSGSVSDVARDHDRHRLG